MMNSAGVRFDLRLTWMLFHIEGRVESASVFGLINMNSCSVTDYYARGEGIAKHHFRK